MVDWGRRCEVLNRCKNAWQNPSAPCLLAWGLVTAVAGMGFVEVKDAEADRAVIPHVGQVFFVDSHSGPGLKRKMDHMGPGLKILALHRVAGEGSQACRMLEKNRNGSCHIAKETS